MGTLEIGIMTAMMAFAVMAVVLFDSARRRPSKRDQDGGASDTGARHDADDRHPAGHADGSDDGGAGD